MRTARQGAKTQSFKKATFCVLLCVFASLRAFSQDFTHYVDPFIGTGGHGHTYPGAAVPFGMVHLSPDTRVDGSWDGCSGYHYSDSVIYGFSHTHLNGTGCSDYGDILLMPMFGKGSTYPNVYSSRFSHSDETASPGYYSVRLQDDNIRAELTATAHVGMHRYTFPGGKAFVVLDLVHRDKLLEGSIRQIDSTTFTGLRRSEAWAKNQVVYYRIEFSSPVIHWSVQKEDANAGKMLFSFNLRPGEKLLVKVALSGVSEDGAAKNMQAEIPHWDFDRVQKDAHDAWQKELSKIEVDGPDDQMKVFYTALYHCFLQPNIYSDVDGMYRGRDGKVHKADGFNYYTVFSLWDTFRAWHPLMTLIDRKRTLDFIRTFLAQYDQGGLLPVWELSSNETECMIGYHAVSVIADAMSKGITDFDREKAFEAMKKSAESRNRFGLGAYIDKGCLSAEDENESVSKTLEYAYDDWCIAQVAKMLNKDEDYRKYMDRSQSWKNLFDPATGFMRPRKNGGWMQPFDPFEVNNNYTEANAWQYTFFVPHDVDGLVARMGGTARFERMLDSLFSVTAKTSGREQADITGMIGQYAQGNEPSHHMAWLYTCVGEPWKTHERVSQILRSFYKTGPDGLIGNEDCGQMSAWYVLNALGLYPLCPGNPEFLVSDPLVSRARIHLENGNVLAIGPDILANLQGNMPYVDYKELMSGGNLPVHTRNYVPLRPADAMLLNENSSEGSIVINPILGWTGPVFKDSVPIRFYPSSEEIHYTTDGKVPDANSKVYTKPVSLYESTTIKAIAINNAGKSSKVVTASFHKMPHADWKVHLHSAYNRQYTAGGDEGLIDGLRGEKDWKKGGWQGYQSQDFECIIDMQKPQEVTGISVGFLQDERSWILMPRYVEYSFSLDSVHFSKPVVVKNSIADTVQDVTVKDFSASVKSQQTRYIKVKAANYGKLPKWHPGYEYGGDAFIFVDEITITNE